MLHNQVLYLVLPECLELLLEDGVIGRIEKHVGFKCPLVQGHYAAVEVDEVEEADLTSPGWAERRRGFDLQELGDPLVNVLLVHRHKSIRVVELEEKIIYLGEVSDVSVVEGLLEVVLAAGEEPVHILDYEYASKVLLELLHRAHWELFQNRHLAAKGLLNY